MENSFLALLYPSTFGVQFSADELCLIETHKDKPSDEIFEHLNEASQFQLEEVNWRRLWMETLEQSLSASIRFTTLFCSDYPIQFRALSKPPLFLSYIGEPIWMNSKLLSVVGSRRPAEDSLKWMSYHLPSLLKSCQLSVVSGGARGVDQWAHRISLQVGRSTLCIVPSGLMNLYPDSLKSLAPEIISSGGALMSSYALNQPMRKFFFHQRNQLIAALGESCLIVEAGIKSGSLVTAKQAGDLGKDVMTLPFSPWYGAGAGSNQLIQDGALLVTNERDLCDYIFRFRSLGTSSSRKPQSSD